jgi:sulfide:quinone oxidoreductase
VPTDKRTLQTLAKPNVFALGDATDLPTSKAGSVTHFVNRVVSRPLKRFRLWSLDAGVSAGWNHCGITQP